VLILITGGWVRRTKRCDWYIVGVGTKAAGRDRASPAPRRICERRGRAHVRAAARQPTPEPARTARAPRRESLTLGSPRAPTSQRAAPSHGARGGGDKRGVDNVERRGKQRSRRAAQWGGQRGIGHKIVRVVHDRGQKERFSMPAPSTPTISNATWFTRLSTAREKSCGQLPG